jgi:tRNA nucleotidyltransferase/poly(A) polymerase
MPNYIKLIVIYLYTMPHIKVYEVGGAVRDRILGIPNKDIDFAVEAPSYDHMREFILERGRIYLENPEFFTIRAHIDRMFPGAPLDADFVLCRKEGTYTDGRRPDEVFVGTIYDDLARRDFTINAIAINMDTGEILDPYNGIKDIERGLIRCVGNPEARFKEDALRMVRALRFSVTKHMGIHESIARILRSEHNVKLLRNVSEDRKKDELIKMFKYDTLSSLRLLESFPKLSEYLFEDGSLWLKPTNEIRGGR